MKQNRVNPDIVTFASLTDAAAKRGDKEAVEEWMSLISVLAKRGDMQGDEYGLNEMRSKGLKPGVATFSSFIKATAARGNMDGVSK